MSARTTVNKIHLVVGRMDNNVDLEIPFGATVNEALELGGYTKADNEVIQDTNGNEYNGSETANEGKAYFLVQRVKSGQ